MGFDVTGEHTCCKERGTKRKARKEKRKANFTCDIRRFNLLGLSKKYWCVKSSHLNSRSLLKLGSLFDSADRVKLHLSFDCDEDEIDRSMCHSVNKYSATVR